MSYFHDVWKPSEAKQTIWRYSQAAVVCNRVGECMRYIYVYIEVKIWKLTVSVSIWNQSASELQFSLVVPTTVARKRAHSVCTQRQKQIARANKHNNNKITNIALSCGARVHGTRDERWAPLPCPPTYIHRTKQTQHDNTPERQWTQPMEATKCAISRW